MNLTKRKTLRNFGRYDSRKDIEIQMPVHLRGSHTLKYTLEIRRTCELVITKNFIHLSTISDDIRDAVRNEFN